MTFELSRCMEVLERTPGALQAMLGGLSEFWTMQNYGESTFSPFDVVGHLIHGERADWLARMQRILEHGESMAFDPFDRYAMYEESTGKTMADLLDEFAALRSANLEALRQLNLTEAELDRRGLHPALGPVTLRNLLATWVVHDLHHTAQIAKSMAYQYREEVGPWVEYLGILPR